MSYINKIRRWELAKLKIGVRSRDLASTASKHQELVEAQRNWKIRNIKKRSAATSTPTTPTKTDIWTPWKLQPWWSSCLSVEARSIHGRHVWRWLRSSSARQTPKTKDASANNNSIASRHTDSWLFYCSFLLHFLSIKRKFSFHAWDWLIPIQVAYFSCISTLG